MYTPLTLYIICNIECCFVIWILISLVLCFFGLHCRYSESLYAVLSLGGVYYFVSGKNNLSVLLLALSGCARSNGVLNAGYIYFQTMHRAYHALFQNKNVTVS
jgi:Gpi18-like mannosyltransferase